MQQTPLDSAMITWQPVMTSFLTSECAKMWSCAVGAGSDEGREAGNQWQDIGGWKGKEREAALSLIVPLSSPPNLCVERSREKWNCGADFPRRISTAVLCKCKTYMKGMKNMWRFTDCRSLEPRRHPSRAYQQEAVCFFFLYDPSSPWRGKKSIKSA